VRDYLKNFVGEQATFRSRRWGKLTVISESFTDAVDGDLVVMLGNPTQLQSPLVRIHSECVFAEAFDSELCDCKDQLELALGRMQSAGAGILFYLRLDGRGIGLAAKVKATALEVSGIDTFESRQLIGEPPECRDFKSVGAYLKEKGFDRIHLMTNNPEKIADVEAAGIFVTPEPLYSSDPSMHIKRLYDTKRQKFGHRIPHNSSDRQLNLDLSDE
jgi:GTP cyclohydrolase II